jgi:hypothetical protein
LCPLVSVPQGWNIIATLALVSTDADDYRNNMPTNPACSARPWNYSHDRIGMAVTGCRRPLSAWGQ